MRNSFCKMQYVLLALLMFALTACGTTQTAGTGQTPGKLTANVTMPTAKSVAAQVLPTTVRLVVTGATIPTAKQDFAGSTGGTIQVYPGSELIVSAYGFDANGNLLYEGFAVNQTVTSGGTTSVTIQLAPPVVKTENAPCLACHETTRNATGQNLIADYKQSGHYANISWTTNTENGSTLPGCAGCHGTQHNTLNPATSGRCYDCHGAVSVPGHNGNSATSLTTLQKSCNDCHNSHNTTAFAGSGCTTCHAVQQNLSSTNYVNDNTGVRAITTEFGKWSHHVTGVDLNDAHCAACHLEGKVSNGAIVVDKTKHMVDAQTHLRNADTDADLAWNPAAPNHTTMDNFCMSCHDADGATSPGSVAIQAFINTLPVGAGRAAVASALNPFGDTISNQYDQLSRGAVVAVKEQFDGGNTSQHGVRMARYTNNNLTTAQFSNISTANYANGDFGMSKNLKNSGAYLTPAYQSYSSASNVRAITKTIGTLYETGKFATLYKPFSTPAATLQDSTQLHCADCHTVGQWKANSTMDASGNAIATVIGAHGSNNEYLLRNSNGSDNTVAAQTYMVCYLCHSAAQYGDVSPTPAYTHDAAITHTGTTGTECNGGGNNNAGLVGSAARIERTWAAGLLEKGALGSGGSGNIFGNRCSNCHNSSDNKLFGGIHGNAARVGNTAVVNLNVGYTTYSSANGASAATGSMGLTTVTRKPYRFLPGLGNFRYNGGVNSDAWTRKSIGTAGKSEKMGCYTLNGTSSHKAADGVTYIAGVSPTKALASGTNVSPNSIADDNGILGSWGACTDHAGSSISTAGHGVNRTSVRPLTY